MCFYIREGSNLKKSNFHSRDNNFPIKISLVICNNKKANGINYAKKYKIPYIFINTKKKIMKIKFCLILKNIKFLLFVCRLYENNFKKFN